MCQYAGACGICHSQYVMNDNIDYLALAMIFDPMINDANNDGLINVKVVKIILDYFNDKITKENVIPLIIEYFNIQY